MGNFEPEFFSQEQEFEQMSNEKLELSLLAQENELQAYLESVITWWESTISVNGVTPMDDNYFRAAVRSYLRELADRIYEEEVINIDIEMSEVIAEEVAAEEAHYDNSVAQYEIAAAIVREEEKINGSPDR